MLRKLLGSRTGPTEAMTPRQGKRLIKEESANGNLSFTIKGVGHPGFFFIFGLMFGGIPLLLLFAVLFGTPQPDNTTSGTVITFLFLIPFLLVGSATFLAGLFLWLGRTVVDFDQDSVSVKRLLFGKALQSKKFQRAHLDLRFEESHKSNDVPAYKLTLQDHQAKNKIGIGGSLKEEELLWLECEVKTALGQETETHTSVTDAISETKIDEIYDALIDPNYRSKNLRFTKTNSGWEAQSRSTKLGAIGMSLFGSIFLFAGLSMADSTRNFFLNLVPALQELFSSSNNSGEDPPIFFPIIFGGAGLIIFLCGFFLLGYRVLISKRHSRLHVERRWTVFTMASVHDDDDFTRLEIKQNGRVNDTPRYRLHAHLKNDKKITILSFASGQDLGQIYARLKDMMPNLSD